jgi:ATP-dependent DNA helicase RecQ
MNYLQLPAGAGRENYYEFDLKNFVSKFSLDIQLVIHSLNILAQEEIISLNEQVFLPSTIQFTINKNGLYAYENDQPQDEPLIKTLLRTYEGIFDFPTPVSERFISSLLKVEESMIRQQLEKLGAIGIIEYVPQKDKPQLYCYGDRVKTEDLRINLNNLELRKKAYIERIGMMLKYIAQTETCRGSFIGAYFGDKQVKACGICDNCLNQKPTTLNETEFVDIHMRLLKLLQKPLHSKDVLVHLKGIRKEKAWKVIDHLQAENKIEVDRDGWIRKIK